MISFLKKTSKATTDSRISKAKAIKKAEEEENIDEPDVTTTTATVTKKPNLFIDEPIPDGESTLFAAKKSKKKAPVPKETPVKEECVAAAKEQSIKIIELAPGQSFYCKELGILFVGKE